MDARPIRTLRLAFEPLEVREALSAVITVVNENGDSIPPRVLASAYHQVQASEAVTLQSLAGSYQQVVAATSHFGQEAAAALSTRPSPQVHRIVERGIAAALPVATGLQVASNVEITNATGSLSLLTNGLFANTQTVISSHATTANALARKGREQAASVVRELTALGEQLVVLTPHP